MYIALVALFLAPFLGVLVHVQNMREIRESDASYDWYCLARQHLENW